MTAPIAQAMDPREGAAGAGVSSGAVDGGYAQVPEPEIPIPVNAAPWGEGEYLTNEEALRILMARNSGKIP